MFKLDRSPLQILGRNTLLLNRHLSHGGSGIAQKKVIKTLLNEAQVIEIREKYATRKYAQQSLGKAYGVSTTLICEIVRGYSYVKCGGPISKREEIARTAKKHNKHPKKLKKRGRKKILSNNSVLMIKKLYASGKYLQKDLAKLFMVSTYLIHTTIRQEKSKLDNH